MKKESIFKWTAFGLELGSAIFLLAFCGWAVYLELTAFKMLSALSVINLLIGICTCVLSCLSCVYTVKEREGGAVLGLFAFICEMIVTVSGGIFNMYLFTWTQLNILFNILLLLCLIEGAVALSLVKKPANFKLIAISSVVACVSGVFWTLYALFGSMGTGYVAGYAILGIGGAIVSIVSGILSLRGKDAFGITAIALLLETGQFILFCTTLGTVGVILGIGGAVTTLIGGVLVADSRENGFIIISFGIIAILALVIVGTLIFRNNNLSNMATYMFLVGAICAIFSVIFIFWQSMAARKLINR